MSPTQPPMFAFRVARVASREAETACSWAAVDSARARIAEICERAASRRAL